MFPLCLLRTSTQPSRASYLRRKSRSCSTSCTKPMGWSPTHRDPSLGASVEQGPPSREPDSPLCQWEHWQEVPRVSLYSWQPCVDPYSAHQNQTITYTSTCTPQTLSLMDIQLPILLLCKQTGSACWPDALLHLSVFLCCKCKQKNLPYVSSPPPSFPVLPVLPH